MRLRFAAVAAVVAATSLSACGLAGDETGTPPAPLAAARSGGVLKVGVSAPGGIDPHNAYEPSGKLISTAMCDTMISLDPSTGQVREALARGWVTQKNSLTVKLRHGVKFNDGSTLESKDVNYSLQQLTSPANGSFATNLGQTFLAVGATSAEDVLADPNKLPEIAVAVAKYDFQVVTRQEDGGALRALAEPALAPIAKGAYEDDPAAFARNPVCVGPYKLATPFKNGDTEIKLIRATDYYGKNVGYTGGGSGYADEIIFKIYDTADAAFDAYQKGEVDIARVPRDRAGEVKDAADLVYGLADAVEFVGLPTSTQAEFTDVRLRTALSQAIDREKLIADVFGPSTVPANGFEPPNLSIREGDSLKGKNTKAESLANCGPNTPARGDVAKAKANFAAATRSKPLTGFTLEVNEDSIYPVMAEALAAQWREALGIEVKVETAPWAEFATKATGGVGMTSPFRIRWSTDSMLPVATYNNRQTYLASLLGADATNYGNWSRWNDRDFNFGLTEQAAPLTDVLQRSVAMNEVAERACAEMPMIPLVFDRPTFAVRPGVIGEARKEPMSRDGVLLLRELYLKAQS